MLPARHFFLKHSARHWFVVLAFLAMTMNLLAGTGFVHSVVMPSGMAGFTGEICTATGVSKQPAASTDSLPASSTSVDHSCCGICLAGAAPLAAQDVDGVLPAPTGELALAVFVVARPAPLADRSHRPRGPPLV
ncbi:MAG: DUF2946 family protein [Rhodocyclaceae bacterium]|nr:DUF2946 family protein [Rhodocyclaceae bacterium]